MPRITLEFSDDEQTEARWAITASLMADCLRSIDGFCRGILKHGEPSDQERNQLEAIRDMVPEIVREG